MKYRIYFKDNTESLNEKRKGKRDRHHIFTYYDIRAELINIFGKPNNESEHIELQEQVKKIHKRTPFTIIQRKLHEELTRKTNIKYSATKKPKANKQQR